MKTFLIVLLIFSSNSLLFGQKTVASYQEFPKDSLLHSLLFLVRTESGYHEFCFVNPYNDTLVDTVVEGKTNKLLKYIPNTSCSSTYGPYKFQKIGNHIVISYLNPGKKKFTKKQYPLSKGDSTGYSYLFQGPYYTEFTQDGYAFRRPDSTVKALNGKSYDCYVFAERVSRHMHQKKPERRLVFLDKKSLLLVRYEFYYDDKLSTYYLLDR